MGNNINELVDLFRPFSDSVGGYWSDSNRQFYQSNPNFSDRIFRTLNPITGLGSAIGSMYDYANKGDLPGMALSSVSAMPLFGFSKLVPKTRQLSLDPQTLLPLRDFSSLKQLLTGITGQIGVNELEDSYK